MRRPRHIQSHVLLTLIGLTCGVLLAVVLAFNLSVRSYMRSRVSAQLETVSASAFAFRKEGPHRGMQAGRFNEPPDRVTGTRADALVLSEDGQLLSVLHGDDVISRELADYFVGRRLDESVQNQLVTLESGVYAVSALRDPYTPDAYLLVYVDMTSITAFTRQVNGMLLVIILAAILISVLLSRRFARAFASPVQTLSGFADEIGGGSLETRELHFKDAEFDHLADSMNRMVTELREAKQKQETFFQNVSHELRTPLTSIRGSAEGIVCGLMEPKSAGRVILSESDKLGGMVEELLYLSRIGRTVSPDQAEPLDLRELLSLCVSEQRAEAEKRGISFQYDFDEDPVLFPIREQDAQRLFGNLISNALRYAESEIRLGCRREQEGILVSVADDGPGVAEADLPHVFERFYKGVGGKHGIGLAIAQSVAESCRGSIAVHNDGGAVFEVRFPVS